jgi:hypothetical protein
MLGNKIDFEISGLYLDLYNPLNTESKTKPVLKNRTFGFITSMALSVTCYWLISVAINEMSLEETSRNKFKKSIDSVELCHNHRGAAVLLSFQCFSTYQPLKRSFLSLP